MGNRKLNEKCGTQDTNAGVEYQPAGEPVRVETHDFPDPEVPKAIPYGVYDLGANNAWVSVGDDHDTAAFAAATIARWWDTMGHTAYPDTDRLLITADAGGSNSYRTRLWKVELANLAARTGLNITVCHYPPGTSKWNKIEHRLFSAITMNWRGRPLTSHQVVVDLIAATTTQTGLTVQAGLDEGYVCGWCWLAGALIAGYERFRGGRCVNVLGRRIVGGMLLAGWFRQTLRAGSDLARRST